MSDTQLPPFPPPGAQGPQVCEATRFYMALIDELPFEQVSVLSAHIQGCPACSAEFTMLQHTTQLVASLPASVPSRHVDETIMAAIRQQNTRSSIQLHAGIGLQNEGFGTTEPLVRRLPSRRKPHRNRSVALVLTAAAVLLLVLGVLVLRNAIFPTSNSLAFHLPGSLTWNGYVLHYTQDKTDMQGKNYQVEIYQDLSTNQMHIESSMEGQFDVVVVTDAQNMLGEDMMHHVAQTGQAVSPWTIDGSLFNLALLKQGLTTHSMTYLGRETFAGAQVYMVRTASNAVLLLDKNYMPVNVLQDSTGPGTGTPLYHTFAVMQTSQVSDSMWDMQPPTNFHLGKLPTKP